MTFHDLRATPLSQLRARRWTVRADVTSPNGSKIQAGTEVRIVAKWVVGVTIETTGCPSCGCVLRIAGVKPQFLMEVGC